MSFWNVVSKAYFTKRPLTWCLLVVLPCLLAAFVAVLFSERYPLKISLGVIVEDDSQGSRDLLFKLENEPALDVVKICNEPTSCESALRNGDVLGVVRIPADLERRAMRGENPVVPLYLSGQSLIAYNMIELAAQSAVGEYSKKIAERMGMAGGIKVPPNPIGLQTHAIGNPSMDYRAYLGVGLVAATFHLAAMIFAAFILGSPLRDKKEGAFFPLALPAVLILFFEHCVFGFAFHKWAGFSFELWQWGILAIASLFMILAAFGFCGVALAITKDMRIATSAGGVVGGPAFAFAGMAFPIFAMPFAVRIFANILPLTHFLRVQNAVRMGTDALPFIEKELLILGAFAFAWFGGAWFGLRRAYKARAPQAARSANKERVAGNSDLAMAETRGLQYRIEGEGEISPNILKVIIKDWSLFFKDRNAVLLLALAVVFYAIYYPLPYINGVIKNTPVAVLDNDNSEMSRQLVRFLGASGDLSIASAVDKKEARTLLAEEKIYGFVEIPAGFERDVRRGQNVSLGVFCNGGYFMVYSGISRAALYAAGTLGAGVQIAFMQARGISPDLALVMREPVSISAQTLFNGAVRYDNYVVPAVLVVIMQQTMVIGICILGVRRRFGRSIPYMLHYSLILTFYLLAIYPLFGFVGRGKILDIAVFAAVFFAACSQMGFFFARFFKKKESAMQVFLYMSIPFLFVSGFSYPDSSIPKILHYIFFFIPTERAIPAFVHIQQAGASIYEVRGELFSLAAVAALYLVAGKILDFRSRKES